MQIDEMMLISTLERIFVRLFLEERHVLLFCALTEGVNTFTTPDSNEFSEEFSEGMCSRFIDDTASCLF